MKVSPQDIDNLLANHRKEWWVVPGTTMTVCCIILKNGFTFTGTSACIDPNNFNEAIGQKISYERALEDAKSSLWKLEGWRLKVNSQLG